MQRRTRKLINGCWLLCLVAAAAVGASASRGHQGTLVADSSIPNVINLYRTSSPSRFLRKVLQSLVKPSVPSATATVKAAVATASSKATSGGVAGAAKAQEPNAAGSSSGNAIASLVPAFADAGRGNSTANASTAASPSKAASANATTTTVRQGRPAFPFPQCVNTTLSYDVSFVGKVQYVQVGSVRYAYHRFGPTNPAAAAAAAAGAGGASAGGAAVLSQQRPVPGSGGILGLTTTARKGISPVVFISGLGMQMYMWPVPLLTRLAEDREVIIFDNMRTGLTTDSSKEKLTIPMMANSTAALLQKLGLKKPDIWSWSVGGFVGYALLAFHSDKVGNVIITAGSPGGPDARLTSLSVVTDLIQMGSNYTALLPYLFPDGPADEGVCPFFASLNSFFNNPNTQLLSPLGKKSLEEQAWAIWDFFNDVTVVNKLSQGATPNPVLILHGVQDRLVQIRNAGLGASRLLSSWMLQFPGQGHGIPFEFQRGIISATLEFFTFASPLSTQEMAEWADAGGTASSFTPQQLSAAIAAESALAG